MSGVGVRGDHPLKIEIFFSSPNHCIWLKQR
jgi:hypothetical protein